MMDIHKILKQLPHRYPFLLVDRVLEVELLRMKAGIFKFKGRGMVAGELAVEAELTCAMRSIA